MRGTQYIKLFAFFCFFTVGVIAQTSNENMNKIDFVDEYGSVGYNDVWGWVGPDGHEYAFILPATGFSVVDLDAPGFPEIGYIPGQQSWWHDAKTYKNYAYTVSDEGNQGIQIIDLSSLPDFVSVTKTWFGDGGQNAISQVHNLYIDTVRAMMYATGRGTQGVHFIDISDPLNPTTVNKISGETHDMCVNPEGTLLVQATGFSNALAFWDITDLENPQFLVSKAIGPGYSHQCWFHDDGIHMTTTIETEDEKIKFWDISPVFNGDEPTLLDEWFGSSGTIAHNVHYEGDVLYVAHYQDGLRILDVRDHSDVKEIAHHDASTSSDVYGGTWGAFPWLPSGKVLHSDGQRGLVVLEPDPAVVPINGSWEQTIVRPNTQLTQGFSVKGFHNNNLVINLVEKGSYNGSIYNTSGKRVYSFPVSGEGQKILPILGEKIESGKYFVKLNSESNTFNGNFIVKN